ncbi:MULTISPECIES: hypothetical protein [16SrI (Aster yellows group)]|uniref:Uncharacterized protein n=2 Tax=16SrI (Aster yellows group) TaxID=3042590 RepID=A0A859IAM3_9MOLU|nr:hypothetical protein [Chrysanthemum yellows phytoplasma]QKX95719.1 MAG: hypothetical protein RP166_7840 [Rapeseed phyllody phytoplasma]
MPSYYIIWTEGKNNLYNLEYENAKPKEKYGCQISKADYSLIQTSKPDATDELLNTNCNNNDNYYNEKYSFINTINNIDIKKILKNSNISSKTPYIRFITKNLEINLLVKINL